MKFSVPVSEEDEEASSPYLLTTPFLYELPTMAPDSGEGTAKNILGAIGKLPYEVLSLIFIRGVEKQEDNVRKTIIADPKSTTRSATRPYRNFALSVAGVCKVWRVIAISDPALWRFITVDFDKLVHDVQDLQRATIKYFVFLARDTPLEVLMLNWATDHPLKALSEAIMPLLRPFWGETHWGSLFLHHVGNPSFSILPEELSVKCNHVIAVNAGDKASLTSPPTYFFPILSTTTSMELYGSSSNLLRLCHIRAFVPTVKGDAPLIQSLKILFAADEKFDHYRLIITSILFNYELLEHLCIRSGTLQLASPKLDLNRSTEFTSLKSLDYCMQDLRTGLLYPLTAASPVTITFPSLTHLSLSSNSQSMTDEEITSRAFTPPRTVTHLTLYANSTGFIWVARECVLQVLLPHSIYTLELDGDSESCASVAPLLQAIHCHPILRERRCIFPELLTLILKGVQFEFEGISKFVEEQNSTQPSEQQATETGIAVQIHACNEDR